MTHSISSTSTTRRWCGSPETSVALGFGFRVGFLGLLHMEVVKERLEREFNLDLIATSPSVDYHVYKTDGEMIDVRSPQDLPEATRIERIEEPYLKAKIICPPEYTGARHAARYRAPRHYNRHDPSHEQIGRDALRHAARGAHPGLL